MQEVRDALKEHEAGLRAGPRTKPEDDCGICLELLGEGGEALVWCASCRNAVHLGCHTRWARQRVQEGHEITCCLCRKPWRDGQTAGSAEGGALNLAHLSRQHQDNLSLEDLYGEERAFFIRQPRAARALARDHLLH